MDAKIRLNRALSWVNSLPRLVGAFGGGAIIGIFATIYHAYAFPIGLLAVLGTILFVFVGTHFLSQSRATSVALGFGLLGVMALLSGLDPFGSILITADSRGLFFLAGGSTITVVSIAWPRVGPGRRG